jgi:hypothetical protein
MSAEGGQPAAPLTAAHIPQIVEAVAAKVLEMMRAPALVTDEVMTRSEAMLYVKRRSVGSFHNWCHEFHVKAYRRGRYSRTHLDIALDRESRRRAA